MKRRESSVQSLINKLTAYDKIILFLIGIGIFVTAAAFGWEKLHYGFNFIDEGYHMTESWRLTQGDQLLDSTVGVLRPYTVLNSFIYRLNPDITLLGFRTLQFFATIIALVVFGFSLAAFKKQYWHLPFIFSLFVFTGLDPTGMISNLSYYTYPHFFLALHLSFMLFALRAEGLLLRRLLLIVSGLFLWGIGFSLLYLNAIALAPILLYLFCRKTGFKSYSFAFSDLVFVLPPFAIGWLIYTGMHIRTFIPSIFEALNSISSFSIYSKKGLLASLQGMGGYIAVSVVIFLAYQICAKKNYRWWVAIPAGTALSILTYFIIETSFFGLIAPYYNGWFGRPMWFSSLLIAFILLFWIANSGKLFLRKPIDADVELGVLILIPVTLVSACNIFFSSLSGLTALHAAIPTVVVLSNEFITKKSHQTRKIFASCIMLVFLLAPFYYTTAWADWRFTYFDVVPEKATSVIKEGYGKGIKTNPIYAQLHEWIEEVSLKYSNEDDFMISYVISPMSHMIAKRRPALDDTFIDFSTKNLFEYQNAITTMKEQNHEPAIAFVFERTPILFPVSLEKGTVRWPQKQFTFKYSNDPISTYIKNNMVFAGEFVISRENDHVVRCYVKK